MPLVGRESDEQSELRVTKTNHNTLPCFKDNHMWAWLGKMGGGGGGGVGGKGVDHIIQNEIVKLIGVVHLLQSGH